MNEECKHLNKAYSNKSMVLTSMPPIWISYWICKDCGFKGEDRTRGLLNNEYEETVNKFNKDANI